MGVVFARVTHPCQPSPIPLSGRPAHRPFRGTCSAFTCVAACTLARSPYVVTAIRRLQTLRLLHACSGRFRLERSPGGACTHWKSAALSRRTWKADLEGLRSKLANVDGLTGLKDRLSGEWIAIPTTFQEGLHGFTAKMQ